MGTQHWHLYVVRCSDGSLYTGVTENVDRTLSEINGGNGDLYVRPRTPVFLAYTEEYMNRVDAERRAINVRRLSRDGKESLLALANLGAMPELGLAA